MPSDQNRECALIDERIARCQGADAISSYAELVRCGSPIIAIGEPTIARRTVAPVIARYTRRMEMAALWIAIVSALGTGAAAIVAWTARADSLRAEVDAKQARSEASDSANRAVLAAERVANIQSRIFNGPPWTIRFFGGDTYLITNNSPDTAHEVTLHGDPSSLQFHVSDAAPWTIGAKSAVKFMFAPSLADGFKRDVIVRWTRDGTDEELEWHHPIPPKP